MVVGCVINFIEILNLTFVVRYISLPKMVLQNEHILIL